MPAPPRAPSDRPPGVPVTIHPGQDVHLRTGQALGTLRSAIATATGRPELLDAPLHVGDRPLDDHHVVGQPPLVAGAVLRTAPARPDPAASALEAPLHLAYLAGPRTGLLHPVVPGATWPSAGAVPGVRARVRTGRRDRLRVRVRPDGRSRVTLVQRNGRSRRLAHLRPGRWAVWKPGAALQVTDPAGRTTSRTELRARPSLATVTFGALTRDLLDDAVGRAPLAASGTRSTAALLSAALLPAVASIALAVALRNPVFALVALVGPLVVLGPVLARRRRARLTGTEHLPVPREERTGLPCARAGLRPADLLTAALASAAVPLKDLVARGDSRRPALAGRVTATTADLPVLPGDLRGGCLAVVGQRSEVVAHAARTVVALHATGRATRIVVLTSPGRTAAWSWARWIPGVLAGPATVAHPLPPGPGTLLVVDAERTPALNARLGAWHAAHGERAALVVLGDDAGSVPSWCSSVAEVTAQTVTWTAPGHATERTAFEGVGPRWLDEYARRVCALASTGRWVHLDDPGPSTGARTPDGLVLPGSASLVDALGHVLDDAVLDTTLRDERPLDGTRTVDASLPTRGEALVTAIASRWTSGSPSDLRATVGVGSGGRPVMLDLLADGPHALVAGTTGAGKSELLQTILLTLALRSSPDDLAIALVDYKGGASFGACVDLPHVVGQVTDLDPGIVERALDGLRAELRRRERLLATVGATNLDDYRDHPGTPEPLPRLLVVVDEFRAMADDHPLFVPGLVRIAAQGRSLGVHLVLATQRPSGAITPDMRANISLRIALRVADDGDSADIIGSSAAASIPADAPGRALVRRGLAAPEPVQTYHAAGATTGRGSAAWVTPRWDSRDDPAPWSFPGPAAAVDGPPPDAARTIVDAVRAAARTLSVAPPRVPWSPDLPTEIPWASLPGTSSARAVLALGTADLPESQRHGLLTWDLEAGHLLVAGRAGTGRTATLRTVAHAARAAGCIVHLVGPGTLLPGARQHVATVADRSDPRRLARLLTLLLTTTPLSAHAPSRPPRKHVLVVDGLEDVHRALASVHRGAGAELLTSLLRDGVSRGIHVAVSAATVPSTGVAALLTQRLLLSGREKHDDLALGIPPALAGRGGVPGRAVLVGRGPALRCQLAVTPPDSSSAAGAGAAPGATSDTDLLRWTVEPVPRSVRRAELTDGSDDTLHLGRGGDRASTTGLALGGGILVCGPHGSGRSAALALVARSVPQDVEIVATLSRDAHVTSVATGLGCGLLLSTHTPHTTARFVELLSRLGSSIPPTPPGETSGPSRRVVVVDDLDVLAQTCPAALDAVQRYVEETPGTVVVASATTSAAAGAFRGLLAELRAAGRGIVLDPGTPGSSEVFGVDLGWVVEPDVHHPGRGAVVEGRRSWVVQLAHDGGGAG